MKNCWIKLMSIVAAMFVFSIAFATGAHAGKIKTFVSIVPQKYFVEKIGGDLVDVSVMVLSGNSPATYEPRPKQMVALSRARLYYAIGSLIPWGLSALMGFFSIPSSVWTRSILMLGAAIFSSHTFSKGTPIAY